MALHVGSAFQTFEEAERAVTEFCRRNFHPIRKDKKESVRAYNERVGKSSRIDEINEGDIFSFRWVCKHFGQQRKSQLRKCKGLRKNQCALACGCTMQILVSYAKIIKAYVVKTAKYDHNHPIGEMEYKMYASLKHSSSEARKIAEVFVEGDFLASGKRIKLEDPYIIQQEYQYGDFEVNKLLAVLKKPGIVQNVSTQNGEIECVVWSTTAQLASLVTYPEVLLFDGSYKVNKHGMPLYSLAVIDRHDCALPVFQALLRVEGQSQIERALTLMKDIIAEYGLVDLTKTVFLAGRDTEELMALNHVFPNSEVLFSRYHVVKSMSEECIHKLVYGMQEDFSSTLKFLHKMFPNYYQYFHSNWLPELPRFAGFKRAELLHLDNQAKNKLQGYHAELENIGQLLIPSLSCFIEKLLLVNESWLNHSAVNDLDENAEVNAPGDLQHLVGKVSSFCMQNLMDGYAEFSNNEIYFNKQEDGTTLVTIGNFTGMVTATSCSCSGYAAYGIPCSHVMALRNKQELSCSDLSIIHKRWHLPTKDITESQQTSEFIKPIVDDFSDEGQRFETVMMYLQPIASTLAALPQSQFPDAVRWLQVLEDECQTGSWRQRVDAMN